MGKFEDYLDIMEHIKLTIRPIINQELPYASEDLWYQALLRVQGELDTTTHNLLKEIKKEQKLNSIKS